MRLEVMRLGYMRLVFMRLQKIKNFTSEKIYRSIKCL